MTSDDLDTRIAALERRVPVDAPPPDLAPARRRARRRALALVAAPVLVLAVAASAVAGAGAMGFYTITVFGTTDPALIGAGLECMTPPEAAEWLAAHGHDKVVWDTIAATAGAMPVGPATLDTRMEVPGPSGAPEAGYVVSGSGADVAIGGIVTGGTAEGGTGPVPAGGAGMITITGETGGPAPDGSPQIGISLSGAAGATGTVGLTTPPAEGLVLVGNIVDGTLHMIVDVTPGASRPATCPAK